MSCLKTNIDTKRGYHRDRATGIVVSECGAISTKFWCITGVVFQVFRFCTFTNARKFLACIFEITA